MIDSWTSKTEAESDEVTEMTIAKHFKDSNNIAKLENNNENTEISDAQKNVGLSSRSTTIQMGQQRKYRQARRPSKIRSEIINENCNYVDFAGSNNHSIKMKNNVELIKSFETFYKLVAISQNQGNRRTDASEAIIDSIEELRDHSRVQNLSLEESIDQTPILRKSDHKEEPKEKTTEQNDSSTSGPMMIQTIPSTGNKTII